MMILNLLRRKSRVNEAITLRIYEKIVAAARQKTFYAVLLVPDTPIGRYEMLSLHMFLMMHRLKTEHQLKTGDAALAQVSQDVAEEFFKDVDHSLRELGIGDTGVPKRMKKLARMYYGRVLSYAEALDRIAALSAGDADETALQNAQLALEDALKRNIRPDLMTEGVEPAAEGAQDWPHAAALAAYVCQVQKVLADQPDELFLSGDFRFPDVNLNKDEVTEK